MQVSSSFQSQQAISSALSTSSRATSEPSSERKLDEPVFRKGRGRRGQGLGVFRQEMRSSMQAFIKARFVSSQSAYTQTPSSAGDVADEALSAAEKMVKQSPGDAGKSLIAFRARIKESVNVARETVQSPDDRQQVDDAAARIDKGLAKLESEAKANESSSASVLEVNTRTKQKSFIKIRTQEGDLVKLSLRRVDNMAATDVAETNGLESKSSTEVSVSSRSRMMLKVDGDLNEAEMAAIKNVFAQAENIANNFFGGDLQAAFGAAEGFEFDAEQLSRVNMRFRMRQVSSASYIERAQVTPPALSADQPVEERQPAAIGDGTPKLSQGASEPVAVQAPPKNDAVAVPPVVEEAAVAEPTGADASVPTTGLASLWNALGAFFQSVNEGFSVESSGSSFKFHYSQEFKLELLKSVVNTVAEEGLTDSVAEQIDAYLSVDQEAA